MNDYQKVISILDGIVFDDGRRLISDHPQDCCENHYLSFNDLKIDDFDGLEFDLNGDFFEKVDGYGIRLIPVNGYPVSIPGYGYNNGYYSSDLRLILNRKDGSTDREFDITECQVVDD